MKIFLYLYPIKSYIQCYLDKFEQKEEQISAMEKFNDLIQQRYRLRGFKIVWLLFSKEQYSFSPNLNLLHPMVNISSADTILASGKTFDELMRQVLYPDPQEIIRRMLPVSNLRLGGFHQQDCVDRVAKAAYRMGIETLIDEETTEQFFLALHLGEVIENQFDTKKWAEKRREFFKDSLSSNAYEAMIEHERNKRKQKPWLVMV